MAKESSFHLQRQRFAKVINKYKSFENEGHYTYHVNKSIINIL